MAGVKPVRMDRKVKRGLTIIVNRLIEDFDNGFERIFPDISDEDLNRVLAAMHWMDQYTEDLYE